MDITQDKKREGFKGEKMFVLPTESFQDYVTHPLIRRLYLTDVGWFPCAAHHDRERKEGIEEYIFIYCMEGNGTIEIPNRGTFTLHENEAFCIPRFCGHHYYACEEQPWSILWVHFKGEDTSLYPLESYQIIRFASENATNRMVFLFDLLFRVLEANYTLGNFIYISQVLSMILAETYYREKQDTTLEQNKQVTQVIRYFYQHISDMLTLEQIEEEFCLSKSYLHSIFQKYTHHSPMDFFIRLKLKEACKLLRSTDLLISEIAEKLGYKDPYYFSRIFKKIVGISPKGYRKKNTF